ncbi:glycosyltransferase family 2 protein [Candidatus Woesearchaeota archaeon]|nr:glycosyltransferase family 2 protein [Candidatus Woesearchaeota archaeon]
MSTETITALLVAYNEEKRIRNYLESVRDAVDEIVIVHDGPCTDNTLKIARKYTNKIFVAPRLGAPEPHRPLAMQKASSEWILSLDADERLSSELKKNIKQLVKSKDVDGYEFYWTFYDRGRLVKHGPLSRHYRLALFRKSKTSPPEKPHEWYKVRGRIKRTSFVLDHIMPHDNWSLSSFRTKHLPRARYDARFRVSGSDASKPAIFYLFKAVVSFSLVFPYVFIAKKLFLNGLLGFKFSLIAAGYTFLANYFIFRFKLAGKLPAFEALDKEFARIKI